MLFSSLTFFSILLHSFLSLPFFSLRVRGVVARFSLRRLFNLESLPRTFSPARAYVRAFFFFFGPFRPLRSARAMRMDG